MKPGLILLGLLLSLAVACSPIKQAVVQPIRVEGIAMEPSLNHGYRILVSRIFDKLERGDIVIFYYPADQSRSYIKRIIGLPNDRVEIREGKVVVNGENLPEPYVDVKNNQSVRSSKEIKVPADNYFVIGDNRDNSNDSRAWGPLPRELIYGKFARKYYSAN